MARNYPQIPWKRFWCPLGQPINCGEVEEGFLADPEGDFGRIWSPNTFEFAQILDRPCLILCGEPGIGKTRTVEMAWNAISSRPGVDPDPLRLIFRDIPNFQEFRCRTFDTPKWQTWLKSDSKMTLIIDGIDEGLIRVPGFIPYLAGQLRGIPLARLQVVLVCRTAEWSLAEGNQLVALWGGNDSQAVFELCPLRKKDAHLAAQMWGVDADKFMKEVFEQHVAGLAARPTTLFFLLGEFADHGAFPGTHFDLYQAGCKRLCEEHDSTRTAAFLFQPTPAQQFKISDVYQMATRIAALLMLCGKSAVHVGHRDNAEPSDLSLDEIAEIYGDAELVRTALSTGLFSARGPERLGFAHQTFAECLAAHALIEVPVIQIRRVLCQRDGPLEHVVPQLAETAAWLAAAKRNFLELLIKFEPEILLRSDVARIQTQHKELLVEAVLERVKAEIAFDDADTSRFYVGLKHPGLAKQLWEYINNPALNLLVRRMAIEIAGVCKLEELVSEFLVLIRAESNPMIRRYLAHSLVQMTPAQRAAELIPFAKGEIGQDPDDEIKGSALRVLIPEVWSVSDALPFLTQPNENFYGAYRYSLSHHIPKNIVPRDVKPLLVKLLEWGDCFDSLNPYHTIAEKTFLEVVQQLDSAEIAELAVEVWRTKSRDFLHFPGERESEFKACFDREDYVRLRFVKAILNSPGTTAEDVHRLTLTGRDGDLLSERDIGWLLEGIGHAPHERRRVWAEIIFVLARPESASPHWDLLLSKIEVVPELKQRMSWLRAYDLDEPDALRLKAFFWEERQRREDWERRRRNAPSPDGFIHKDLAEIQAGNTFWWMRLCEDLALRERDTQPRPFGHDITESPGWQGADEQCRKAITEGARRFLIQHQDGYAAKGFRTNYSDPGYLAIWLLREEIRANPILRTAVAENWIDAITGRFNNGEEHHQEMAALAYELNPDRCVQGLLREILDDDTRHAQILALGGYSRCWDARLTKELVALMNSGRLKSGSIESALYFLAGVDPQAAVECVKVLLLRGVEEEAAWRERTKGILCVGLAKLPAATWDFVWPLIEANKDFAEHVLAKLAYGLDYSAKSAVLPSTSEQQLAEIYLLLNRIFPPETDPPFTSGFVTARQEVPQLRADLIRALTARGTEEACKQLLRLSEAIPNQRIWLRWQYWGAMRLKRRKVWQPLSPLEVGSLLKNPAARIIEDEDDLANVVLESLGRLQTRLTKNSLPEVGHLWNYDGSGNRRKNFRPKDEEDLSDKIAAWLDGDIGPESNVVIGREVQPRRGQKTDIKVVALPIDSTSREARSLTIIIEVKGCWNTGVRTALKTQLVEDYLAKNGWTHGLYVVGWYLCDRWDDPASKRKSCLKSQTYEDAIKEVEELAKPYTDESSSAIVKATCLDCRFPV
jgi:hypothetical protein